MPARHAILGLLLRHPLHGYDIDGEFDKGLRAFCHVNISQIYAYLKSMEEQGWVKSQLVLQKSNPPKKVFHATPDGQAEMEQWLRQPIQEERQVRDELLTKIYFCWLLAPDTLPDLLDEQIAIHRHHLHHLEESIENSPDFITTVFREAGRRHTEADYEWLLWLRERVAYHLLPVPNGSYNGH